MNTCGLYGYGDIVGKGVFEARNLSLYAYGALNPLRFFDPDGNYNREAAVAYANEWALDRNIYYKMNRSGSSNDCANFASQVMRAGKIFPRSDWFNMYTDKYNASGNKSRDYYSPNWSSAKDLATWLRNSDVLGGEFKITAETSFEQIRNAIDSGGIKQGDLIGWSNSKDGNDIHHFGVVTDVSNGKIKYNAHTKDRHQVDLPIEQLKGKDKSIVIFHIKDDAE